MKIVYVHGLASDPTDPLLRSIAKRIKYEGVFLDYSDIYEEPGWPRRVITHVREQIPPEEHVFVAHSMGGPIATYLQNELTKGMVLLAPAFSTHIGLRFTLLAEAARKGYAYFEVRKGVLLKREDLSTLFNLMKNARPPQVPFAIVLGEEDFVVDNAAARGYFKRANERRGWLVEIAGAGHVFAGREEEVAHIVQTFVDLIDLVG